MNGRRIRGTPSARRRRQPLPAGDGRTSRLSPNSAVWPVTWFCLAAQGVVAAACGTGPNVADGSLQRVYDCLSSLASAEVPSNSDPDATSSQWDSALDCSAPTAGGGPSPLRPTQIYLRSQLSSHGFDVTVRRSKSVVHQGDQVKMSEGNDLVAWRALDSADTTSAVVLSVHYATSRDTTSTSSIWPAAAVLEVARRLDFAATRPIVITMTDLSEQLLWIAPQSNNSIRPLDTRAHRTWVETQSFGGPIAPILRAATPGWTVGRLADRQPTDTVDRAPASELHRTIYGTPVSADSEFRSADPIPVASLESAVDATVRLVNERRDLPNLHLQVADAPLNRRIVSTLGLLRGLLGAALLIGVLWYWREDKKRLLERFDRVLDKGAKEVKYWGEKKVSLQNDQTEAAKNRDHAVDKKRLYRRKLKRLHEAKEATIAKWKEYKDARTAHDVHTKALLSMWTKRIAICVKSLLVRVKIVSCRRIIERERRRLSGLATKIAIVTTKISQWRSLCATAQTKREGASELEMTGSWSPKEILLEHAKNADPYLVARVTLWVLGGAAIVGPFLFAPLPLAMAGVTTRVDPTVQFLFGFVPPLLMGAWLTVWLIRWRLARVGSSDTDGSKAPSMGHCCLAAPGRGNGSNERDATQGETVTTALCVSGAMLVVVMTLGAAVAGPISSDIVGGASGVTFHGALVACVWGMGLWKAKTGEYFGWARQLEACTASQCREGVKRKTLRSWTRPRRLEWCLGGLYLVATAIFVSPDVFSAVVWIERAGGAVWEKLLFWIVASIGIVAVLSPLAVLWHEASLPDREIDGLGIGKICEWHREEDGDG